jgi:hypothetical protein
MAYRLKRSKTAFASDIIFYIEFLRNPKIMVLKNLISLPILTNSSAQHPNE